MDRNCFWVYMLRTCDGQPITYYDKVIISTEKNLIKKLRQHLYDALLEQDLEISQLPIYGSEIRRDEDLKMYEITENTKFIVNGDDVHLEGGLIH